MSVVDHDLYAKLQKVVDLIIEEMTGANYSMYDLRRRQLGQTGVYLYPRHHQTASGLFLELWDGNYIEEVRLPEPLPIRIWTPWGEYTAFHVSSWDYDKVKQPRILERLGAVLSHKEAVVAGDRPHPVYEIHGVDDLPLPEPRLRDHNDYIDEMVARQARREMRQHYEAKRRRDQNHA